MANAEFRPDDLCDPDSIASRTPGITRMANCRGSTGA
jgi:hypothetical protein